MNEHDPSAWLASIVEVFDQVGVDWALAGALAANRFRVEPRFTTDIDALVESHPGLVRALEDAGYDVDVVADTGEDPHLIRCHRGGERIDILLPVVAYQREALARAVDHRLTVEDVIIHKLIAWRMRDRDDIRSILSARPTLDRDYLERWVGDWELDDRWRQAQADV